MGNYVSLYLYEWAWNAGGIAGEDTLTSTSGSSTKQVPITIPNPIRGKINILTGETIEFFVSEVLPNIVTNNATIDIATVKEGNLNVSIYDLAGSKIMNVADEYVNENTTLKVNLNNLSNLAIGSYVVVITSGNDVATRKFIKQ